MASITVRPNASYRAGCEGAGARGGGTGEHGRTQVSTNSSCMDHEVQGAVVQSTRHMQGQAPLGVSRTK
jgi:hypothetical protein